MRRGTLEKSKVTKAAIGFSLENKNVARRNVVDEVLTMFKAGNRDVNKACQIINEGEQGNQANMLQALEQLSDVLCGIGHFGKAYDLLEAGFKYIPKDPVMHELIARVAFIMENFDKCIVHNKKAAELQPAKCCHNNSDIGLAYYRLGIQQANTKHFELAFKHCRMALTENPRHANAMVNMGLIYRNQNAAVDASKMFQAANEADPANISAIVNLGALEYERNNFETAAIRFLDALEIKQDDEEALCNLALALKKTQYIEFAMTAFEEAVNVSPGNTFILQNYMLFLLEQKKFEQFLKVMTHAKRVMDKTELDTVNKLYEEFKAAIDGSDGKSLPEDDQRAPLDVSKMKSALKKTQDKDLQIIFEE